MQHRIERQFEYIKQVFDRVLIAGDWPARPPGGIKLSVRGSAHGITPAEFAKIAEDAKAVCPVSKALTGTVISLEVAQG